MIYVICYSCYMGVVFMSQDWCYFVFLLHDLSLCNRIGVIFLHDHSLCNRIGIILYSSIT